MDADGRDAMRQWIENWKRVGPVLEEERWERLRTMSDDEAQRATGDLLDLWQPDWRGDDGEALLLHQRVFGRVQAR